MSDNDIISIVEAAIKPKTKVEVRKLWVGIFGFTGIILTIGFVGGDWFAWRRSTTEKVDKLEQWRETFKQTGSIHYQMTDKTTKK